MKNAFWNRLRERKYLVLLLTMASTIVVQPLAHGFLAGLIISEVLRNLVVVTVLFIVFQRRHVRLVSLLIGLPVMASNWAHYTVPERKGIVVALVGGILYYCGAARLGGEQAAALPVPVSLPQIG
jgi:hypothetical protein